MRDHPRVCGEHYTYDSADITGMGSSPRVRGTHDRITCVLQHAGIIPACAGNTVRRPAGLRIFRDHPRVCGEHWGNSLFTVMALGSSPRVRGTLP